jgi:hypothetical protein
MKKLSRRTWILLGVVAVAAVAAIGGYAYFNVVGGGAGNANVATAGPLSITNDTPGGAIAPDGPPVPVVVRLGNTGGSALYVGTITGTVRDGSPTNCSGSWFTVAPIIVNGFVPTGASTQSTTISMPYNGGVNQTACAGGQLIIDWTSN